jgi:type II secretory pathway component GspD/PulD (secretin)
VNTAVRVKDGETIVIGGLMQKKKSETKKKIPFLGDVPYIGGMFRSTSNNEEESEVLIMITPHILRDEDFLDIDI